MKSRKVAIIADTALDVPVDFAKEYDVFLLPISVIFSDGEYRDQMDISTEEVYRRLHEEIPKTSLPSGEMVLRTFDAVAAKGYEEALFFTLSSGMSGTYNLLHLMTQEETRFQSFVFDTKNIGLGGGFFAMHAAVLAKEGYDLASIKAQVCDTTKKSKQFGKFKNFEFLEKGGRIGLVTAKIGTLLNIKPIISVNDDGVVYTATKVKGNKKARKEMVELLSQFLEGHEYFCLSVQQGEAEEEASIMIDLLEEHFPGKPLLEGHIGTAFGVHTGPGMIVIGAYIYK